MNPNTYLDMELAIMAAKRTGLDPRHVNMLDRMLAALRPVSRDKEADEVYNKARRSIDRAIAQLRRELGVAEDEYGDYEEDAVLNAVDQVEMALEGVAEDVREAVRALFEKEA